MSRNVSGIAGFEETKGGADGENILARQKKSKAEIQKDEEDAAQAAQNNGDMGEVFEVVAEK